MFMSPFMGEVSRLAAILFVDDCDLLHINMDCEETALETLDEMQMSVRTWGALLITLGVLYKPPKCFYHIMLFKWDRTGQWSYEANHTDPDFQMVVPMPDGLEVRIDNLPVAAARETLGVVS